MGKITSFGDLEDLVILKIKIRSPKRGDLENQDQDRDLKIKIASKITYYAAY